MSLQSSFSFLGVAWGAQAALLTGIRVSQKDLTTYASATAAMCAARIANVSCDCEGIAYLKRKCDEIRNLVMKIFNGDVSVGLPVPPADDQSPWLNAAMWQSVEGHVMA